MNRDKDFAAKAQLSWSPAPDWVTVLAELADAKGLKAAGEAIGYSDSLVSNVIAKKYPGDIGRVEEKVRGALLGLTVDCPGTGESMSRDICLDWQKKPFEPTSQQRCRMYRACRNGCPHFRKGGGSDGR